jgi:hypothetical protein
MSIAAFSCNVTYTPGGGGALSQNFNLAVPYSAISAGKLDVPSGSSAAVSVPFGGVGVDTRGLLIQNNTDVDIEVDVANTGTAQYHLAPGGLLLHWSPKKAAASALVALSLKPATATAADGSIDFIVLGE